MQYHALPSGQLMPMLGLGTFRLSGNHGATAVAQAIELGYTHIDTANNYENEDAVGQGIKASGQSRDQLFITTKVGRDNLSYKHTWQTCEKSLRALQLDYVDLLLIHWPNQDIPLEETLTAFADLVQAGKVKNIGISNFIRSRVDKAVQLSALPIAVNQVEYHPFLNQEHLRQHCQQQHILLTAYSPLAIGAILTDETLLDLATKHAKTPAQIALRWLLHKKIAAIPKASSKAHMAANMDLFNWQLSTTQIARIDTIPTVKRVIDWWPGNFDQDE